MGVAATGRTIALAGNPNTGKTSLFNALTGSRQRVGNWPGVTVERKEGRLWLGDGDVTLVDLPGIYSLGASSVDEQIATEYLLQGDARLVLVVADASNLERSLYLAVQLREMGRPLVLALNMQDVAEARGMRIDAERLGKELGVPVVPTVAREGTGVPALKGDLSRLIGGQEVPSEFRIPYGERVESSLERLALLIGDERAARIGLTARNAAIRAAEGDAAVLGALSASEFGPRLSAALVEEGARAEAELGYDLQTALIERRWAAIGALTGRVLDRDPSRGSGLTLSDRVDRIVTHRLLGLPIFLVVAWALFRAVYLLGDPVSDLMDGWLGELGEWVGAWGEGVGVPPLALSFLQNGVVGGVGAVVVFLPQIFLLFAFVAALEDSGYMARGAFVMDRIMRAMGLHGKSFIPMLTAFGCNVPSIMATRILERPRDRMITLLVLPFMSCSARMPVYLLFAGTFFGARAGTAIFSLYVLGVLVAVIAAKILGKTLFAGESSQFVMELPPYHLPRLGSVLRSATERAGIFVRKAGTVILATVAIVWVLASFPAGVEYGSGESWAGRLGHGIAPLLAPAGFGSWQAAVSLFFGFMAKEVVVGSMGTLFGTGEEGLAGILPNYFSPLSAYAFLVMTLLYVPCVTVVAAIRRETNSWRWTLFAVGYTTLVGYVLAVAVYQGGLLLGLR
jgi:ferrous iron transport protein B